jgi:predicted deacylase
MGGRGEDEERWAERIARGLRRALGLAGVLTPVPKALEANTILVGPTQVLRPSQGGVFVPNLRARDVGTIVERGTELGYLVDPVSYSVIETYNAPFDQTAILLIRPTLARIEGGAMTYVIAEPRAGS